PVPTEPQQAKPVATAQHPSQPAETPDSPAPIAQVAAIADSLQTAAVETTDFSRDEQKDEVPADWVDDGWKGHSLIAKCQDASAAVLTEVSKLESSSDETRKEGLTKLALMGPEAISAIPAVRNLLNDQNQLVCAHAAWAVWEIEADAQTALEVLQQSLSSKSTHVVQFACYTLGNLGEA